MSKQITLIQAAVAAILLAIGTGHATPQQEIVKLPRVVITGKATPAAVQVAKIEQLPRVVIVGRSVNTQQQQLLASTAAAAPVAVKFIARAL